MDGVDKNGHLFARFALDGIDYCLGCGHTRNAPEAAAPCVDADGLAADVEAQALLRMVTA